MSFLDLTGIKFGRLTVMQRAKNQGKRARWECKCECGNIIYVRTDSLKSGNTKSCGCLKKELAKESLKKNGKNKITVDLTNQKFGKLIVISLEKDENNHSYWKCQCECGNIIEVNGSNLRSGHTISCGCIISKGEQKIIKLLKENNIPFETQKTFENCYFSNTGYRARFDFI